MRCILYRVHLQLRRGTLWLVSPIPEARSQRRAGKRPNKTQAAIFLGNYRELLGTKSRFDHGHGGGNFAVFIQAIPTLFGHSRSSMEYYLGHICTLCRTDDL